MARVPARASQPRGGGAPETSPPPETAPRRLGRKAATGRASAAPTATATKPPLAPKCGRTRAVSPVATASWVRPMPVNSTAAHRSGVAVRLMKPMLIHSRTPSGTPASPRTNSTPGPLAWVVARSTRVRATAAAAAMARNRTGLSAIPAAAVTSAVDRASSMAARPMPDADSRCSSARAENSRPIRPEISSASRPSAMAAAASVGRTGGPATSSTWSEKMASSVSGVTIMGGGFLGTLDPIDTVMAGACPGNPEHRWRRRVSFDDARAYGWPGQARP